MINFNPTLGSSKSPVLQRELLGAGSAHDGAAKNRSRDRYVCSGVRKCGSLVFFLRQKMEAWRGVQGKGRAFCCFNTRFLHVFLLACRAG